MQILEGVDARDLITIGISAAALGLSWWAAVRTGRLSRAQLKIIKRQGEAENRISAAAAEQAREQTRLTRDSDIIAWAGETMALLSEMAELPVTKWDEGQRGRRWHALRHRLSAQIDIGRFYFPNYAADLVNTDRPPAYRGHRQQVLDHLVAAYDLFDEANVMGDAAARSKCKRALVREKRQFVSEVQVHIDPRRYIEFLDSDEIDGLKADVEAGAAAEPEER